MDPGGRNCTIALKSRSGHLNLTAIVGLVVFLQYWCAPFPLFHLFLEFTIAHFSRYWYPFLLFISLAVTPTAIIGVNENLDMPAFTIKVHHTLILI